MDNANVTQPSLRVDHLDIGADERLELAASMVRAGLALMTGLAQIRDRHGRHVEAIRAIEAGLLHEGTTSLCAVQAETVAGAAVKARVLHQDFQDGPTDRFEELLASRTRDLERLAEAG
jgi:hypothetical protein